MTNVERLPGSQCISLTVETLNKEREGISKVENDERSWIYRVILKNSILMLYIIVRQDLKSLLDCVIAICIYIGEINQLGIHTASSINEF